MLDVIQFRTIERVFLSEFVENLDGIFAGGLSARPQEQVGMIMFAFLFANNVDCKVV